MRKAERSRKEPNTQAGGFSPHAKPTRGLELLLVGTQRRDGRAATSLQPVAPARPIGGENPEVGEGEGSRRRYPAIAFRRFGAAAAPADRPAPSDAPGVSLRGSPHLLPGRCLPLGRSGGRCCRRRRLLPARLRVVAPAGRPAIVDGPEGRPPENGPRRRAEAKRRRGGAGATARLTTRPPSAAGARVEGLGQSPSEARERGGPRERGAEARQGRPIGARSLSTSLGAEWWQIHKTRERGRGRWLRGQQSVPLLRLREAKRVAWCLRRSAAVSLTMVY